MIFRRAADAAATPSPEYSPAAILARLGVLVANASGAFTAHERDSLHRAFLETFDLTESERRRLDAHVEWLAHSRLGTSGLKKQLEALAGTQRARIGAAIARVAAADGVVNAGEMRTLEKLYASLGLGADDLYRNVHAVMSDAPAETATPQKNADGVTLDMARVRSKLAETAAVSSLLTELFADNDDVTPPPATVATPPPAAVLGPLDVAQAAFLRELVARGEWPRHDVESLASSHSLLVDGTLEAINDYAFDRCGDPIWEGDDPLVINHDVAREILT